MAKSTYTSWHKVVKLREDLRSGELSLAVFAADLYDVVMGRARPIYQRPDQFFALTYPTFNLRELAKDVLLRLAGQNDRSVRQLELTYGGGKTHSLITLYHLVNDPDHLPDLPAVHEFRQHAGGIAPPRARVAVVSFDKLDVEKGMEVHDPKGETRWLRHPWSVIAFQIAGQHGLRILDAEGKDQERETPPAENLLRELLAVPGRENLSTLILIDEVLMFAREKISLDPQWRHRLVDFFQYLTQAMTKVDRACLVASLLATDPRKSDELGKEIAQELYAIFRREREEGIQPVEKQDVAEILRRRFFTPDSIRDREAFRPHVVAALEGIQNLDEATRKNRKAEEDRYLASYPFHPDLTETMYTKWTQLEGFQRTRGVLRTFAMALRDSQKWDTAPLVGPNVLLNAPGKLGLSEAARELASIATSEEYEGRKQEWSAILQGETEKAQEVQKDSPALKNRELEEAVLVAFLHSQPVGQRALTRDLLVLLGATRPDRIEMEKALRRWTEVSWWLDEEAIADAGGAGGTRELPKTWRLGTRPNLKQMHSQALTRVQPDVIQLKLTEFISKEKRLTEGWAQAGARVHNLPRHPKDIEDDGEFRCAVLGPVAACEPGKPGAEATRFIREKTDPENPRIYQNAVILITPSRDGLELLRDRVRDYLAWEEVKKLPEARGFDETRGALLGGYVDASRRDALNAVVQAYNMVVALSAKGEVEAFRITPGASPLFETIRDDKRTRIQVSPISPDALSPDGPYDLWRSGEVSRRVSDLVKSFAQFPHLPKMLRQKEIADTVALGCEQGLFVLRSIRPDKSVRTLWRVRLTDNDFRDRDLEVVLPEAAELQEIGSTLLAPGALPGLWPADNSPITVGQVLGFFDGSRVAKVKKEGYEEALRIPKAARDVVERAVSDAVKSGVVWLLAPPASVFKEDIPLGVLTEAAALNHPPEAIPAISIIPQSLPSAWTKGVTTAAAISSALSAGKGQPLPWPLIAAAIDAALHARMLERTGDSGPWPCGWPGAALVKLQTARDIKPPPPPTPPKDFAEADIEPVEFQDFADALPHVLKAGAGLELRFVLRVELKGEGRIPEEQREKLNEALGEACPRLKFG